MTAAVLLFLAGTAAAGGTSLPLKTESAETLPGRALVLEASLDAEQTPHIRYHSPEGYRVLGPVLGLRYGLADRVELQFSGPVQVWAYPTAGGKRSEVGDFSLWTKWHAVRERERRPAFALRWGVKLPNASDQSDLGTDEVDFHLQGLAGKTLGAWRLDAHLGLGILGDPTQYAIQNDVMTYGVAATRRLNDAWSVANEFEGSTGKGYLPGYTMGRWGGAWEPDGGPWRYFAAVTRGITALSPDWGVRFGAARTFNFARAD